VDFDEKLIGTHHLSEHASMTKDYGRIVKDINDVKSVNSELDYKASDLLKVKKNLEEEIQALKLQISTTKADRDLYADKFNNASAIHQKIFDEKMQSTMEELKKYMDQVKSRDALDKAQKDVQAALERDLHASKQDTQRLRHEVSSLRTEVEAAQARCDSANQKLNSCQVLPSPTIPHLHSRPLSNHDHYFDSHSAILQHDLLDCKKRRLH
jgi:chromosome segregation ATPase